MTLRQTVFVAIPLLFSLTVTAAAQVETCTTLIETALNTMDQACSDLTRNQVCYGHTQVQSQLREVENETAPTFETPADVVEVTVIEQLATSPLNTAQDEWGIAVMNLQADVPATFPGQAVVFLLMGDVEVVDGATGRADRDPMQAFYFSAGVGPADCKEAPSTMAILSPEDVTVNLTINGMDVTLGSMITLVDNQNNTLTITTHEGSLGIPVTGTVVGANESVDVFLNSTANVTTINAPRPATADELALASTVNTAYDLLQDDPTPATTMYTVQGGDTLFSIARANGTCVEAIVTANGIANRNVISVGQVITIPDDTGCDTVAAPPAQVPAPAATTPAPVGTEEVAETAEVIVTEDPQPALTDEGVVTVAPLRTDEPLPVTPEVFDDASQAPPNPTEEMPMGVPAG